MPINFNEPLRNYLLNRQQIDAAIMNVLASGYYILGSQLESFERKFADYCGVRHCSGVASGTDALLIALRAIGVAAGDEVITVSNAGGYSSVACFQIGAVPVYVDVEPDTLVMDPEQVIAAISGRTRAIIATHLFGNMVDMASLRALAAEHALPLIEDCSQAHGAVQNGRKAGSFGDIGVFSFYPTKNLGALGDGGALVCSDDAIASAIRELRQYGWGKKYTIQRPYGTNSRLDPLQAAVLEVKLPFLDAANERRRELAHRYSRNLAAVGIQSCHRIDHSYTGHLYVIRHERRDALRETLGSAGVGTDIHYPVLDFEQPAIRKLKWRALSAPVSQEAAKQIISLPLYPELTEAEVDAVCSAIEDSIRGGYRPLAGDEG